ncbi:MAG: hypothetical protein ACYDH4_09525 [Candidatus Cryosericum sp.]
MSDEVQSYLDEEAGVVMLVDPDVRLAERAEGKKKCAETLAAQETYVQFFRRAVQESATGFAPRELLIIVLNTRDPYGALLSKEFDPNAGDRAFTCMAVMRKDVVPLVRAFEPEVADKIAAPGDEVRILVVDHMTAEVFE